MSRSYILGAFRSFGWNSVILYTAFSAFVFTFSHIFLKNNKLLAATFVMGLILTPAFFYYPDLISVSVSHAVLGIANISAKKIKRD